LASRYDAVLNCIPAGPHVAASPQLWLAFEIKDRPFALLYPGFDGFDKWKDEFAEPLQSFDLILLSDYVKDDLDFYAPLSKLGRVEQDVRIGSRLLRVYSRDKWLDRACLTNGQLLP
jgi:hypothetical protein